MASAWNDVRDDIHISDSQSSIVCWAEDNKVD